MQSEYRNAMRNVFEEYLRSDMWGRVRLNVILRDGGKCRECKRTGKIVHHKTYRNWGKGNVEEAHDCILLCDTCHDFEHISGRVIVPFFAKRKYDRTYKLDEVI